MLNAGRAGVTVYHWLHRTGRGNDMVAEPSVGHQLRSMNNISYDVSLDCALSGQLFGKSGQYDRHHLQAMISIGDHKQVRALHSHQPTRSIFSLHFLEDTLCW